MLVTRNIGPVAAATLFAATLVIMQGTIQSAAAEQTSEVVLASDIKWEALNPARGDRSPQAGTLWGDRKGAVPTGFLARFVDGFSSPPHIHNVTYRAVVISGHIHNDDPKAERMWMPAGSFWTQPKGQVHITAAKGRVNIALVEIDNSPYLVRAPKGAFDSGERPINVDRSNIVWVDLPGLPAAAKGPKIAYLWGKHQGNRSRGTFVKLPAGFTGAIQSQGSTFRAVVIKGRPEYQGVVVRTLEPGSYFGSKGQTVHKISSQAGEESVIYVRTNGRYKVVSARP